MSTAFFHFTSMYCVYICVTEMCKDLLHLRKIKNSCIMVIGHKKVATPRGILDTL